MASGKGGGAVEPVRSAYAPGPCCGAALAVLAGASLRVRDPGPCDRYRSNCARREALIGRGRWRDNRTPSVKSSSKRWTSQSLS